MFSSIWSWYKRILRLLCLCKCSSKDRVLFGCQIFPRWAQAQTWPYWTCIDWSRILFGWGLCEYFFGVLYESIQFDTSSSWNLSFSFKVFVFSVRYLDLVLWNDSYFRALPNIYQPSVVRGIPLFYFSRYLWLEWYACSIGSSRWNCPVFYFFVSSFCLVNYRVEFDLLAMFCISWVIPEIV